MSLLKPKKKKASAIPLPKDTIIENYKILSVIGVGGFSVVYSALDLETNKPVAIKEYYATNCMRRTRDYAFRPYPEDMERRYKAGIKRFFDEGLTLSQIEHPNLVRVNNFFRANNTAYLVMEFERGKDFRWFLKKSSFKPDEEFMFSVFGMVLSGVNAIHKNDFLHLDIKPSNILMRTNGAPLILDLGASYSKTEQENRTNTTLTHGYSSPEQHKKGSLGTYSDLYSIAMTMRACITHKSPLSAEKRLKKDNLKPLVKTHSKKYSHALLATIDQASALEPSERPQTIDEFVRLMTS